MKMLTRCLLPFLIAVPSVASAETPSETVEVIGDKPAHKRPSKPNLQLKVPDFSLNSQVFDFPTGLRIIMQSDRTHPIVSVLTVVDHGAGDDPEGKAGTAHFAEHTWFRSVHGALPPVMTVITDLTDRMNATTRPDTTDFRTVTSSEYLPILLRLESLRLVEPYIGVTDKQIETEREVIRNEWRRRNEQSTNLIFDYLLKSVFPPGHPYHERSTNETIDRIDLPTLQAYFDEYYKPENTTVVVVGDFDPAEARSLIFENFDPQLLHPKLTPENLFKYPKPGVENPDRDNPDDWLTDAYDPEFPDDPFHLVDTETVRPRVTGPSTPPPMPPKQTEIPEFEAAVDNQTVMVGWSLPGGFRGKDIEAIILANTATGAIRNYMRQAGLLDTPDKKKGLKDPGCFALPMKEHSIMACIVEVTDTKRWKDPERVADLMMDQLSQLWNPELVQLTQKYFGAGKMEEMARVLRSVDNVAIHFGGRAEDIGFHAHQTGSVTFHSDSMNEVNAIDIQNVADLGYEYLKRDRAAIVVVNPIPTDDIDTSAESSSYHGATEEDAVLTASDDLTGVTEEQIEEVYVQPDLTGMLDKRMENGLRVVVVPHGESPLVQASLVFNAGSEMDKPGLRSFVLRFKDDDWTFTGGQGNDPLQIAAEHMYAGPGRPGWNWSNAWGTSVRGPAGNLDGALWMLREEVETVRPDIQYKNVYVDRAEDRFFSRLHGRDFHMSDLSQRHLYPDDPTEWPTQYSYIQDLKSWNSGTVKQYIDRHYQPANATLVIVGNIDGEEALRQAVEFFGGWEPRSGTEVGPVEGRKVGGFAEGTSVLVFDNPKRTQSQITRECRLNAGGVEDIQAMAVLSSLVRDRIFQQLRIKEGLAYSPGGSASMGPDGSAVLAYRSLAVNVGVGRTVEYFRDLTTQLEEGEADDTMLNKYKLRRARAQGVGAQSTDQLTSKLIGAVRWDQPWTMLTGAGSAIANVDAKQIQRIIDGCNGRSVTTIEGPVDVITPQLDERGIAYEVVDYEARGNEMHEKIDPKGYKKHVKAKAKADKKKEAEGEEDEDGSADNE